MFINYKAIWTISGKKDFLANNYFFRSVKKALIKIQIFGEQKSPRTQELW